MFIIFVAFLLIQPIFVECKPNIEEEQNSGFSEFDIVKAVEGESVRMTCTSGMAKKYCMFSNPNSTEIHNVDETTMSLFNLTDLKADTREDVCGIIIPKVEQRHAGEWICQVHVADNPDKQPGGNFYKNGYKVVNRKLLLQIVPPSPAPASQPASQVVMKLEQSIVNNLTNGESIHGETLIHEEKLNISLGYHREPKKVKLSCPVDGNEQEELEGIINWTYNGGEPSQMGMLEPYIVNVNMDHNGAKITCNISSNRFSENDITNGINIATVNLNVMYRPIILNITSKERFRDFQVIYRSNPASEITWAPNTDENEYDTDFQNQTSRKVVPQVSIFNTSLINKDIYKAILSIQVSEIQNENWTYTGKITVNNTIGSTTQDVDLEEFLNLSMEKEKLLDILEVSSSSSSSSMLAVYIGLAVLLAIIGVIFVGLYVAYKKRSVKTHNLLECSLYEASSKDRGSGDGSSIEVDSSIADVCSKEADNDNNSQ